MPKLKVDERYVWAELLCLRMILVDVIAGKRHEMEARKAAVIAGQIERLAAAVVDKDINQCNTKPGQIYLTSV